MVEHLPPDGALARAASRSSWTTTHYQVADLADRLGRIETDFRNANRGENDSAQPYPDPVWRPGDPLPLTPKQQAKADAKAARQARQGYNRIVAIATPQYAEKG